MAGNKSKTKEVQLVFSFHETYETFCKWDEKAGCFCFLENVGNFKNRIHAEKHIKIKQKMYKKRIKIKTKYLHNKMTCVIVYWCVQHKNY